jgi:hypothetical protein
MWSLLVSIILCNAYALYNPSLQIGDVNDQYNYGDDYIVTVLFYKFNSSLISISDTKFCLAPSPIVVITLLNLLKFFAAVRSILNPRSAIRRGRNGPT